MTSMCCARFVVSGRVQGVFFRAATQQEARKLGITGWVRNCDDGSVELVARGSQEAIARLEDWLKKGPPNARVAGVVREVAGDEEFRGFSVRY